MLLIFDLPLLRLEEFHSHTEKNRPKRTRKTKQNKENYVQRTAIYNNHIILAPNKSIDIFITHYHVMRTVEM